ncbi:MAG TPA: DUF4831 family protein [Bacteroidales bacterium]|nr:DUF4831 family protein [Bacteroidales bacterium]
MMNKNFFLVVVSLVFLGCNSKTIQVEQIGKTIDDKKIAVYYTLPRTVVNVKVVCSQCEYIPGPYAEFAKKFLGIEGVSNTKKVEYFISKIDIETHSETDPYAIFAVYPSGKGYGNYLRLSATGLILPVNQAVDSKTITLSHDLKTDKVIFKDLSPNPFVAEETATFYGRTLRDSVYVRVPIQRSMTVERNLEEKAKEAADFIFSIRKKRLDFLTPDVDHPFAGDALQVILKELQRLEDEYLALFIGIKFTHEFSQILSYVPSNAEGESAILFRFSESKGLLTPTDLSGRPILIELDQPEYPENFDAVKGGIDDFAVKAKLDRFYYRIPVVTSMRILDGKQQLASKRLSVYQYGLLAQLPVDYKDN